MSVFHEVELAVLVSESRMLMTRVGSHSVACLQVDDGQPDRYEQACLVALAELCVDISENLCRCAALQRPVLDEGLGNDHEQCSGNSLARDICHDQGNVAVIHHEEVVEVSPYFLCGNHGGVQVELLGVGIRRENPRQHVGLDLCSDIELCADALLLRRDPGDLLDVFDRARGKVRKRLCKNLNLILGAEGILHLEEQLVLADFRDLVGHPVDGPDDSSCKKDCACAAEYQRYCKEHDHGCPGRLHSGKEFLPGAVADFVVLELYRLGGRRGIGLVNDADNCPVDCIDLVGGHEVFGIVDLDEPDVGSSAHGVRDEESELGPEGLSEVEGAFGNLNLEYTFGLRRKDHMSGFVEDNHEPGIHGRRGNGLREEVQEDIESHDRD